LHLIADGNSNRAIAEQLVITVGTVKSYTSQIYSKLGVSSRTQAVAQAREIGLIP
jgi:LuxR family maltose regulon positive regulatory protein